MKRRSESRKRKPIPHAQMAASPHPVKLDGKTYIMSPLSDRDWGELELWMQMRPIALAKEAIRRNSDLDQAQRDVIMSRATDQMMKMAVATPEGAAILVSVDGISMLTWIGLRARHPDVTFENVRQMMFKPENINAANDAFEFVNMQGPTAALGTKTRTTPKSRGNTQETEAPSTSPSASTTHGQVQMSSPG